MSRAATLGQDALAQLRALAEAARDADADYHRLPSLINRQADREAAGDLSDACDHATVLALLDEIETLRSCRQPATEVCDD